MKRLFRFLISLSFLTLSAGAVYIFLVDIPAQEEKVILEVPYEKIYGESG